MERLGGEFSEAKLRIAALEEQVFFHKGEEFAEKGDVLLLEPPMRPDSVRRLADAVARRCGGLAAVFAGPAGGAYSYALVQSDGTEISARVKALNAELHGRAAAGAALPKEACRHPRKKSGIFSTIPQKLCKKVL